MCLVELSKWRSSGVFAFSWAVIGSIVLSSPAWAAADLDRGALPTNRGIGQRLANFTLKDATTGRDVVLYGFAGRQAAVLVFMGTECPLANLYAPRLAELNQRYRSRGVAFLAIYPNAHESTQQVADHARKYGLEFPALRDPKNVVADTALVQRTPEALVLDGMARIRYRGAIDDQYGLGTRRDHATHTYLKDAIESLLAKRPIAVTFSEVPGCPIDRIVPEARPASKVQRVRPAPASLVAAHKELGDGTGSPAGEVCYASSVARIIQEKCQGCHRPGQVAPFPLVSYDDARKHASMIHEVVDQRRMPPWHADPRYGHFANDRSLTSNERATLMAWVEQGSPLGDPKDVPAARSYPEGWTVGKPDLVVEIPERFTVPAQGVVEYVRFRVPSGFTEDRWIQAAEAQPDDRSVVHHIVVYVDDHKGQKDRRGGLRLEHLCGYAPGDMPSVYAPGTAKKIAAGSDLIFELHYTPIGRIRTDRSKLGLTFAKVPVTRRAYTVAIAEDQFIIPPRTDDVAVAASLTLGQDIRLISFMPHMHLRGKDFRYSVTRPGKSAEVLLSVPAYDFGWQTYYTLKEPLELPRGSRIDCLAHFDNSERNPYNPDPSKTVSWGDQTFEEMMIGYVDIDLPADASIDNLRVARQDPKPPGNPVRTILRALGARQSRAPGQQPAATSPRRP